jgi:hypothetical protein
MPKPNPLIHVAVAGLMAGLTIGCFVSLLLGVDVEIPFLGWRASRSHVGFLAGALAAATLLAIGRASELDESRTDDGD